MSNTVNLYNLVSADEPSIVFCSITAGSATKAIKICVDNKINLFEEGLSTDMILIKEGIKQPEGAIYWNKK